jgi:hypothetical protein
LRAALSQFFDVTSADGLVGSYTRHAALSNALHDVDVVVVALPAPEDPASANVFVEVGAALGARRPVVLVGERAYVPADLADLPVFRAEPVATLASDIELVATSGVSGATPATPIGERSPGLPAATLSDLRRRTNLPFTVEAEAVGVIDDLFRATGARTINALVLGQRVTDSPDLAVWHDDLVATLGAPLPVEILARSSSWPMIRQRLERTLSMSGGRTLLGLYLGPSSYPPKKWSDGRRTILIAAADQLLGELAEAGLGVALTRLLAQAEP